MGDDYPILQTDTIVEWLGGSDHFPDLVRIEDMWVDKDGDVQLRITETHPDTMPSPRTIALSDLHEQLEWREYRIDQPES